MLAFGLLFATFLNVEPPVDRSVQTVDIPCKRLPLDARLQLDAMGVDLGTLARIISCTTGERFLFAADLDFVVRILAPGEVTVRDAREAFLGALDAGGFVTARVGKFTRIMPVSRAASRSAIVRSPSPIDWTTEFIKVPSERLAQAQLVAKLLVHSPEHIGVHTSTSTLMVTASPLIIRRLGELFSQLGTEGLDWDLVITAGLPEYAVLPTKRILARAIAHLRLSAEVVSNPKNDHLFILGHRPHIRRLNGLIARLLKWAPSELHRFMARIESGTSGKLSDILQREQDE